MWRKIDKNKYGLQPIFDGKLLKRLFYLSVWSMLHSFISMAPWFLFFIAIEHLGKMELAVSNITRSVSTLFFVIVSSLGATNGSLVSNLLGAGQQKGVFPICHKIIKMGYAIGFPLVGVALFCDYWIIGFYTNNETLVQHTVPPFIVMLFNYIFAVPGYVYISAVTGTGKTKIAFIFQVVTIMVYLLYLLLAEPLCTCTFSGIYDNRISVCHHVGNTICHLLEKETLLSSLLPPFSRFIPAINSYL